MKRRRRRKGLGQRLVDKLESWEAEYWPEERWTPRARFAARMLGRLERWRGAWLLLRPPPIEPGYCNPEIASHPWHERIFYRGKGAVCLVLGLVPSHETWRLDDVDVVWFDLRHYGTPDGDGSSWKEVRVGYGYFRNWFAFVTEDSAP